MTKLKLTKGQLIEMASIDDKELIDEAYPTSFDMSAFKVIKSFKDRMAYCAQNLQRIGAGSSRVVYKIDDDKVLKLAKNKKGIAQNKSELDIFRHAWNAEVLTANVFDFESNLLWIEMELATPVNFSTFKNIIGVDFITFGKFIVDSYWQNNGRGPRFSISDEDIETLENNDFVSDIINLMLETNLAPGDFKRISSYGLVKRNGEKDLVLIDYGATEDVIDKYYKR